MFLITSECLLILGITAAIGLHAFRRDRRAPVDDMGVIWLVCLSLYTALPTIVWLLKGMHYGPGGNSRLIVLRPTATDIVSLTGIATVYAIAFAAIYFAGSRGIRAFHYLPGHRISQPQMIAAIAIIALYQIAMLVVRFAGLIEASGSYLDSYRIMAALPTFQRQLLRLGGGLALVSNAVLVVAMMQRWPKHRKFVLLYLLIWVLAYDPDGSRATILLPALSIACAWHILVRAVPLKACLVGGFAALVLFAAAGMVREGIYWDELSLSSIDLGEFDHSWANAVDVLHDREKGTLDIDPAARFGELFAFIPSQVLPFEKQSASDWFIRTFYPAYQDAGGGLTFGAVAQAVVGGGIWEALLRGMLLGWIAARLTRWYRGSRPQWWHLPLYLYLLVQTYQSVRDTSFHMLTDVVQLAIPALIIIAVVGRLLNVPPRIAQTSHSLDVVHEWTSDAS